MVSLRVAGKQDGVLLRRDTSHHALKHEQALAPVAEHTDSAIFAYNDGKGCAEVVC